MELYDSVPWGVVSSARYRHTMQVQRQLYILTLSVTYFDYLDLRIIEPYH